MNVHRLRPWLLPLVLLLAAAGMVAGIVGTMQPTAGTTAAPAAAAAATPAPSDDDADPAPTTRPLDDFAAVIERPLFEPTRRPRPVAAIAQTARSDRPLVLAGVYVSQRQRLALIMRKDESVTERLEVGGVIDGWRVEAITPAGVTLRRGTDDLTLPFPDRSAPPPPLVGAPAVSPNTRPPYGGRSSASPFRQGADGGTAAQDGMGMTEDVNDSGH